MEQNPCIPGWKSDLKFYLAATKAYIKRAEATTNENDKEVWLRYARKTAAAAEIQLNKLQKGV